MAVDAVVERMISNPRQFPVVHNDVRRALLRRFPYASMFVIDDDGSPIVLACFHGSRDPARWQRRV
jgi:plasmid stabilization system protein ParE